MTQVPKIIPALTGGVSQQPPALRYPGQLEEVENTFLSLVDGASKRSPTNFVAELIPILQANSTYHVIERDGDDYILVLSDLGPSISVPGIRVFNLDGVEQDIRDPDGDHAASGNAAYNIPTHYIGSSPDNYLGDWEQIGVTSGWTTSTGVDEAGSLATSEAAPISGYSNAVELWDINDGGTGLWTHEIDSAFGEKSVILSVYTKKNQGAAQFTLKVRNTTQSVDYAASFVWSGSNLTTLGTASSGTHYVEDAGDGWWRAIYVIETGHVDANSPVVGDRCQYVQIEIDDGTSESRDYYWGMQVNHNDSEVAITAPAIKTGYGPFRFLTIADATFVLNTEWNTRMGAEASPTRDEFLADISAAPEDLAWVAIQQSIGLVQYTVTIKNTAGTHTATHETAATGEDTKDIAGDLAAAVASAHGSLAVNVIGSVFEIYSTSAIEEFSVEDGAGDTVMIGFTSEVQAVSDLPLQGRAGYRVKISPDPSSELEDYFVKAVSDEGGDTGSIHWVESTDWDVVSGVDRGSMPHQLQLLEDDQSGTKTGTPFKTYFTFGPAEWVGREVGNALEGSNPAPSFVGSKINDIFFTANRLGFLSGQNLIMSEAGVYFNTWRTSVLSVPESDPIDIAVNEPKLATLYVAGALDEQLIVSSEQAQFVLDGSPVTPQSALLNKISSFRISNVRPVLSGKSLIFSSFGAEYAGAQDFFRTQSGAFSAEEISQPVPKYMEGTFTLAESYPKESMAFFRATSANTLFCYKYAWAGDSRVQAAWSKWVFSPSASIEHVDFLESQGVILTKRGEALHLETIEVGNGLSDAGIGFQVMLDRRVRETACTKLYAPTDGKTTITLPYDIDPLLSASDVAVATTLGVELAVDSIGTNTIVVFGDHESTNFWAGERYTQSLTLTEPIPQREGTAGPIQRSGHYAVQNLEIQVAGTGAFEARVTPRDYGETFIHEFTAQIIDIADTDAGEVQIYTGSRLVGMYSPAEGLEVQLTNSSVLPSRFISLVWNGDLSDFRAGL